MAPVAVTKAVKAVAPAVKKEVVVPAKSEVKVRRTQLAVHSLHDFDVREVSSGGGRASSQITKTCFHWCWFGAPDLCGRVLPLAPFRAVFGGGSGVLQQDTGNSCTSWSCTSDHKGPGSCWCNAQVCRIVFLSFVSEHSALTGTHFPVPGSQQRVQSRSVNLRRAFRKTWSYVCGSSVRNSMLL